jgi:hypothetical protein
MPITEYVALRLDGDDVTFLEKAEGGAIYAEVAPERKGSQGNVKKRIGKPQYEDFSLQVGWTLSQALFDWIAASWQPHAPRKNGAVLTCDTDFMIQSERAFADALIQEVTLPALDASSKEPGYLTVRFTPQEIVTKTGKGQLALGRLGAHKLWRTSSFRLQIDGLDADPVRRIEPLAIRRGNGARAGRVDFPNLKVSLAQAGAQSWIDWHEDFVLKGHNDEQYEKEGALLFLTPDSKTQLARIDLHHLGIFRLAREAGTGDRTGYLQAELYCESMEFHLGKA